MNVIIDQKLYETYSEIRLGCLSFQAEVRASADQFWDDMNKELLPEVRASIEGREWSEIPGVRGSRLAYKAFGRNPGRYRVSSEALLRRVRRGDDLYRINSVVDVNNRISLRSGLSAGSYDLDQLQGDIVLRKAGAGEGYPGIGKDFLDMENMLILSDDKGPFGSSMSDSTRAMVTGDSHNILTVIYCFEESIDLPSLLNEASDAFIKYAGVTDVKTWIA